MKFYPKFHMMSAEDVSAVKIATEMCLNPQLKREILRMPGSIYDIKFGCSRSRKEGWYEIVEEKATALVGSLCLPKQLQQKVEDALLLIAIRMLNWAVYHEAILGLSSEQSFNTLNASLFTQQGLIDSKKAAVALMKMDLSIKQQYKLACLYCFTDQISSLFREMMEEEGEEFYDTQEQEFEQPELVKFWTFSLVGEIDQLRRGKSTFQYMLESAIKSGSRAGVECCLEEENSEINYNSLLDAARKTVKRMNLSPKDEYFVFQEEIQYINGSWVPNNYFIDILCFLLSKMNYAQQINFFRKDQKEFHSSIVGYFLDWPYQENFMKAANLMWPFLTKKNYCNLLELISRYNCSRIKIYDYNELFRDFWCSSPERYKRYIFSNESILHKSIGDILISLVSPDTQILTIKSWKNVLLILADATNEEKKNIIYSYKGTLFCMKLVLAKSWRGLDEFILDCIPHYEVDKFKRELIVEIEVKEIFLDFVKSECWDSVESLIKWSSLNKEEINLFKKDIIYSRNGKAACGDFILYYKNIKPVQNFIRWWFPAGENIKAYIKELVFSSEMIHKCACLIKQDELELVNEFVNWSLSSGGDIKKLKKQIAFVEGSAVCKYLLSNIKISDIYDKDADIFHSIVSFEGCKWEQVEMFLTWVFSSEREINAFKKGVLLESSATSILFSLVRLNKWEEAETFFDWIGLTPKEIKELKKKTFFRYCDSFEMFLSMVYTKYWDTKRDFGSKQEGIELLLRWFLTDKETALEFKDKLKNWDGEDIIEPTNAVLNYFNLAINQRLKDLHSEQKKLKRKFCDSEF